MPKKRVIRLLSTSSDDNNDVKSDVKSDGVAERKIEKKRRSSFIDDEASTLKKNFCVCCFKNSNSFFIVFACSRCQMCQRRGSTASHHHLMTMM